MDLSYADLVELSQHYDGKSCEEASVDHPTYGRMSRVDRDGTFHNLHECCLVKKCVWKDDGDGACSSKDARCPSEYGTINPKTCREEDVQRDSDGHEVDGYKRRTYYFSTKACCRPKLLLGDLSYDQDAASGCSSDEPWAETCCPKDSPGADAISDGLQVT